MTKIASCFIITGLCFLLILSCAKPDELGIEHWVTMGDQSMLLKKIHYDHIADSIHYKIKIDTSIKYQTIEGFGFSLTGGSAMLLSTRLAQEKRTELLRELFLPDEKGIGINYLRISIGASDLDEQVFNYSEEEDPNLKNFSLAYDTLYLIPILNEILQVNPSVKIMASPWSAPTWMKDNLSVKGGRLLTEHFSTYANYLVRYVQAMKDHGISVDAMTLQNEPENPHNTPSMLMSAEEQAEFVGKHLGPAFKKNQINTKIIAFDHNCDHPEYPINVLNDSLARTFIDGSAFHLYLGEPEAMNHVYTAHPDKKIYFTEQWTSGEGNFGDDLLWHIKNVVVGSIGNWSSVVLEWNLANDPQFGPHTDDGGCTLCQGAITIGDSLQRNVSYYIIAHASKFVPRGSVRVHTDNANEFPLVAFLTPAKEIVFITSNDDTQVKTLEVKLGTTSAFVNLPPRSVSSIKLFAQ